MKSAKKPKLVCKYGDTGYPGCILDCFTNEPGYYYGSETIVEVDPETGIAYTREVGFPIEADEYIR